MPQQVVYTALHTDYSEDFIAGTEIPEDECGKIAVKRLLQGNKGHYGCLEHPQLSLAIKADHNTIMQLRTHRVGCTFDVQSMRYTGERIQKCALRQIPVEEVFYCRPPGKYNDRQGDPYTWTEQDVQDYMAVCWSSAMDYDRLRTQGVSEEHARMVLATGYYQNALISGSLRFWLHLLDVRSKANAQLEVRIAMDLIALQVQRWCPEIFSWWQANRQGKAILAP
tara:strand:+ start:2876 stop:3547 length:672 start_codon:yes stop_codon:yes gene_type:complete